jgi:hypothetical protein
MTALGHAASWASFTAKDVVVWRYAEVTMHRACDRELRWAVDVDGALVGVEAIVAFPCLTDHILRARAPLGSSDLVTARLAPCAVLAELRRILTENAVLRAHDARDALKGTSVDRLAEIVAIPHRLRELCYYVGNFGYHLTLLHFDTDFNLY